MVNEISNKTLAVLLVGAIFVSLFGTFISLSKLDMISAPSGLGGITGLATGNVTLAVSGLSEFTVTNVDFGTIIPNSTAQWISTNTTNAWIGGSPNDCSNASGACAGILISNDGNSILNLSFYTNSNASTLIGGTNPKFSFMVRNDNQTTGESGCNGTVHNNVGWTEITANQHYDICNTSAEHTGFGYPSGADKMVIEFNLTIPADTPQTLGSQANLLITN